MITQDILQIIQLGAVIVAVVWAIAKIKEATASLTITVNHLSTTVDRLEKWVTSIDRKVEEVRERTARIEGEHKRNHG